eukprot:gene4069-4316_t
MRNVTSGPHAWSMGALRPNAVSGLGSHRVCRPVPTRRLSAAVVTTRALDGRHFEQQDVAGSRLDTLTWRLAAALAEEDYAAAAAIKPELAELAAGDAAAVVQTQLAAALQQEDYGTAATLRDTAAAGLMGWWCCASEGDPAGHLLHISPE